LISGFAVVAASSCCSGLEQQDQLASLVEGLEANYAVHARSAAGVYPGCNEAEVRLPKITVMLLYSSNIDAFEFDQIQADLQDATSIESAIQYLEEYHAGTYPRFPA
jgi:hypothetical protein